MSGGGGPDESVLDEQIAYYRARAPEYDEWWLRLGRYDHGAEKNAAWFAEIRQVEEALESFAPGGDVLELAAGTGIWSERLVRRAESLTCVDASPEALGRCRSRLGDLPVRYVVADLFAWRPERSYDTVFFGFWLSHVPEERLAAFWATVGAALRPGGRVFFVDSRYAAESTAIDQPLGPWRESVRERLLNDGRRFRVVKVFHDAPALAARLSALGWQADLRESATHFLYGSVLPAVEP